MVDPDRLREALTAVGLGMPRLFVAFTLLPFFASQNSALLIRLALSFVFTLPILPALMHQVQAVQPGPAWLLLLVCKEAALGLVIGFTVALPFWIAEGVGFIIDNQRGATIGGMSNTLTGNESSMLAILFSQSYLVMFLALGGLTLLIGLLYRSHALWPATAGLPAFDAGFAAHALGLFDALLRTVILLAAPAMICMLLSELALAVISLFAPQMQVFFMAMPVKSGVALFVLVIYFSTLMHYMGLTLRDFPGYLDTLGQYLR